MRTQASRLNVFYHNGARDRTIGFPEFFSVDAVIGAEKQGAINVGEMGGIDLTRQHHRACFGAIGFEQEPAIVGRLASGKNRVPSTLIKS